MICKWPIKIYSTERGVASQTAHPCFSPFCVFCGQETIFDTYEENHIWEVFSKLSCFHLLFLLTFLVFFLCVCVILRVMEMQLLRCCSIWPQSPWQCLIFYSHVTTAVESWNQRFSLPGSRVTFLEKCVYSSHEWTWKLRKTAIICWFCPLFNGSSMTSGGTAWIKEPYSCVLFFQPCDLLKWSFC